MKIKSCLGWMAVAIAASSAAGHILAADSEPQGYCRVTAAAAVPGVVNATVRDADTGGLVAGAIVEWRFSGHAMTGSTDGKGRFAFQLPIADQKNGQPVELTIKRNGYAYATTSVRACPGTNPPLALKLAPTQRFGTVEGQVLDPATGNGIPNAMIAILIGRFPAVGLTATTGIDGKYLIRRVGLADGLTLQVTTDFPPCVAPTTRKLDVQKAVVTENFALPLVTTDRLRCPPTITGPGGPGSDPPASPAHDPSLADSGIQWQIATDNAILVDDGQNIWNSGHINDILKTGPSSALVASDTSGVWGVSWNGTTGFAVPISTDWNSINMTSLTQGPDGTSHVYAGTTGGGVLWETDTSVALPLLKWLPHQTQCGNINHILVINEFRRIALACDNGVWWSPIPSAPAAHGAYNWQPAQPGPGVNPYFLQGPVGTVPAATFARLAKGPGWGSPTAPPTEGTIVATAWGPDAPNNLFYAAPDDLIFWGGWSNGQLVLNGATVATGPGQLFLIPGRTSVAACPADPRVMYATASTGGPASSDDLLAVWKSSDAGQNWTMVNLPSGGLGTGHQGDYNQAIAVSPADATCNTFAIGWSYATFVSFDGGSTYPMLLNGTMSGCGGGACNLHDDYHAPLFDPLDPQTLWIGSDGGLASASGVVKNGTPTFASYYNEHLFNLQFYHTSPSSNTANLVAGPLQDNAVVWSVLPNWWSRIPGSSGDGAYTEFTGVGPASGTGGPPGSTDTLAWNSPGDPWQQSVWNGSSFSNNPSTIPVADNNNPRDPAGITGSVNWNVRQPSYSNTAGELMYGVDGQGQSVYGLFAASDGSDLHWEMIGSIGGAENVNAVSSHDGNVVFVGTDHGNICQLTQPYANNGPCVDFTIDQPQGGSIASINGLLEFFPSVAIAAASGSPAGSVLTFAGQAWQVAGGGLPTNEPFISVDGPDLGAVFAASANQVFVTHDLGSTWLTASDGLPSVAQINELHFVVQGNSTQYMYLSTYGWSMFRAPLQ